MIVDTIDGVYVEQFDSLGELVEYARDNTERRSSDRRSDATWYGSASLDDAVQQCLSGWHDIRPQVDEMFSRMEEHINMALGEVFETRFDVCGDSVDIDRFLVGEPEHMMDYVMVPAGRMGRVVRVLVNGSASCQVDPERILQRGTVVTALIDLMSKLGVGVEVWLESASRDSKTGSVGTQLTMLHSSEQRLDIDNLMFALAHPSMLRRIGFSVMERSAWKPAKYLAVEGGGYGTPHNLTQGDRIKADVCIDRLELGRGNEVEDGVAFVMSTVRGLDLMK